MPRINPLRLALLSLALLGSVAAVARADDKDGPTPLQLRPAAQQAQVPSMPRSSLLAQGKSGIATDAGMAAGPIWGAGIYDQTDSYRDRVSGIGLPGSSSESIH